VRTGGPASCVRGIEKVLVTNRTYQRAVVLAEQFKGEAIPFEEMNMGLKRADIVISATDSPQYLIRHDQVARVVKDRRQKPIFFIDIARPPRHRNRRSVRSKNAYLYNIDDLQKVTFENIKDREKGGRQSGSHREDRSSSSSPGTGLWISLPRLSP